MNTNVYGGPLQSSVITDYRTILSLVREVRGEVLGLRKQAESTCSCRGAMTQKGNRLCQD